MHMIFQHWSKLVLFVFPRRWYGANPVGEHVRDIPVSRIYSLGIIVCPAPHQIWYIFSGMNLRANKAEILQVDRDRHLQLGILVRLSALWLNRFRTYRHASRGRWLVWRSFALWIDMSGFTVILRSFPNYWRLASIKNVSWPPLKGDARFLCSRFDVLKNSRKQFLSIGKVCF